jgi:hypothetical protein
MIQLFIKETDIAELTGFSGNIDADSLIPAINVAQTTHLRRILGVNLYNKIAIDIENDDLIGDYLTIYNDYVVYMTAFFSASIYLSLNTSKTTNAGTYKLNPENTTSSTASEVNTLGKNYEAIAIVYETNFREFMKTITIPEYGAEQTSITATTNLFNWY